MKQHFFRTMVQHKGKNRAPQDYLSAAQSAKKGECHKNKSNKTARQHLVHSTATVPT